MHTPTLNRFLFAFYLVLVIGVFVMSLLSPEVRAVAYAPVRDTLLPPATVTLPIVYSTEKEGWLEQVRVEFENSAAYRANGKRIILEMTQTGSQEMINEIVNGESQPVLISPASSLQSALLEHDSRLTFGRPVVTNNDCTSVVETPLVLVAWQERAEVLWGDAPPNDLWWQLHDVLSDDRGWRAQGQPDWGFVKFGHTDPSESNSGLMTLLLMAYGYHGKTSGLNNGDILDGSFQDWVRGIENSISDFGDSTGTYMETIVTRGPSTYDLVAVYEATAIEQAENAANRYGQLRVYYPPATVVSDHPFCILEADWVTAEQREAAQLFIDYLQSEMVQTVALNEYGFRPTNPAVQLDQPSSPFVRYTELGLRLALPPEVTIPDGPVLSTLIEFWLLAQY